MALTSILSIKLPRTRRLFQHRPVDDQSPSGRAIPMTEPAAEVLLVRLMEHRFASGQLAPGS